MNHGHGAGDATGARALEGKAARGGVGCQPDNPVTAPARQRCTVDVQGMQSETINSVARYRNRGPTKHGPAARDGDVTWPEGGSHTMLCIPSTLPIHGIFAPSAAHNAIAPHGSSGRAAAHTLDSAPAFCTRCGADDNGDARWCRHSCRNRWPVNSRRRRARRCACGRHRQRRLRCVPHEWVEVTLS